MAFPYSSQSLSSRKYIQRLWIQKVFNSTLRIPHQRTQSTPFLSRNISYKIKHLPQDSKICPEPLYISYPFYKSHLPSYYPNHSTHSLHIISTKYTTSTSPINRDTHAHQTTHKITPTDENPPPENTSKHIVSETPLQGLTQAESHKSESQPSHNKTNPSESKDTHLDQSDEPSNKDQSDDPSNKDQSDEPSNKDQSNTSVDGEKVKSLVFPKSPDETKTDQPSVEEDQGSEIGEYGFRYKGPEPTRYGDWAHKGRVTDF